MDDTVILELLARLTQLYKRAIPDGFEQFLRCLDDDRTIDLVVIARNYKDGYKSFGSTMDRLLEKVLYCDEKALQVVWGVSRFELLAGFLADDYVEAG